MQETEKNKKKQILEAAARLFRDKGYAATSMRDLAREVSLQASSLYNHIESKEQLLREICFGTAEKFLHAMEESEQLQAPARDKIEHLLRCHVRMAVQEPISVTSFNDEWRHLQEPFLTEFRTMRQDYERRFLKLLQQGIAAGQLTSIEPRIALFTLFSAIRWLYDWFRPGKTLSAERVESAVLYLLMNGLFKQNLETI
jgi:AcrR family transcriptional regulator